ncbi:MAG: DUF5667 domain-containing protein [Actinobacteria bacterium]|nr:DUF5667 domain-containing protein [Actinomycetota bacterium]
MVQIANALAKLPEPEIDATFAVELEQLLLTDGVTAPAGRPNLTVVKPAAPATPEPVPADTVVRMPSRRFTVRRSLTAAVAAASLAAFPLVAAASSLPGSPFYGLKQLEHRIELAFANGPVARGFDYMRFANGHVSEAEQMAAFPTPNEDLIAKTLAEATAELNQGSTLVLDNTHDAATLTQLANMAAATGNELRGFAGEFGGGAAQAAQDLLATSQNIQQQVANVLGFSASAASLPVPADPSTTAVQMSAPGSTSGASSVSRGHDAGSKEEAPDTNAAKKAASDATEQSCRTIGQAQLGATLRTESIAVCQVAQSASRY